MQHDCLHSLLGKGDKSGEKVANEEKMVCTEAEFLDVIGTSCHGNSPAIGTTKAGTTWNTGQLQDTLSTD
jgi:hypothetical protein